jgi:predicted branched-subunit amino acid permease
MVIKNPTPQTPLEKQIKLSWRGTLHGMRSLLPISIFVIPFGIAFGVAAADQDVTVIQTIAMSILIFSGAAQFASLELWREPIAFGSLALIVLAVNARHVVIGAALSPWVNALPLGKRMLTLGFLSDANFADSQPAFKSGERDIGRLLGGGLILWINWVVGTTIGILAGARIGDPEAFGLDVIMVCFFAAAITGRLGGRSTIIPALIASVVAVLSLDFVPVGWNIILAAVCGGIAGTVIDAK